MDKVLNDYRPPQKPTKEEAEKVIESVSDLIDDRKFEPFFFKHLYLRGSERFLELADEAREEPEGRKGRKFTTLLKYGRRRY